MNLKMFAFRAAAVSVLLVGCGTLIDMGGGNPQGVERRVYVNDAAPNESLPSVIINEGVYFVMHPGKSYQLRVRTPTVGQQIQVLQARGNFYYNWKTIPASSSGDSVQFFTLQADPDDDSTRYYRAFLQSLGGGNGIKPQTVRFRSTEALVPTSLKVKVVMLRQLTDLPQADRTAFGQAIVNELVNVYTAFGISVTGSVEIVEPTASRFVATFGGQNDLPGTREPGTAYLYVVDNVSLNGTENPDVLGFAPREGFDLASDVVILNVRGDRDEAEGEVLTVAQRAAPLGVTAAHELGHLFGLRHTSASKQDRDADFDKSNTHDGFSSLGQRCVGLVKSTAAAEDISLRAPDGRHYCLRTAATESDCTRCPDAPNLMFAYQCGFPQKSLVTGQQDLLLRNIRLFQP